MATATATFSQVTVTLRLVSRDPLRVHMIVSSSASEGYYPWLGGASYADIIEHMVQLLALSEEETATLFGPRPFQTKGLASNKHLRLATFSERYPCPEYIARLLEASEEELTW